MRIPGHRNEGSVPAAGMSFEKNGLDIVRYWAAFCVMFLHYTGYALAVPQQPQAFMQGLRRIVTFFPPVVVFITLSGFLVSASFERCGSRSVFCRKRLLRLYPPLWICTLVNLAVIAVLYGEHLDRSVLPWLATQAVGLANTPSCLKDFATGSVNGALWTIFVEIQLYAVLAVFYPLLQKLSVRLWCIVLAAAALVNLAAYYAVVRMPEGAAASRILERLFLPYALWFLTGVFLYLFRDRVLFPLVQKFPAAAGILGLFVLWRLSGLPDPGYYTGIVTAVCTGILALAAGYLLPPGRIRPDLTYEIFLYHWIVLNVIIHFDLMARLPWLLCLLLYTASVVAVSFAADRFTAFLYRLAGRRS